jgi:hypothetical protein
VYRTHGAGEEMHEDHVDALSVGHEPKASARSRRLTTVCKKVPVLPRPGTPRQFLRADKSRGLDANSVADPYIEKIISIASELTLLALLSASRLVLYRDIMLG